MMKAKNLARNRKLLRNHAHRGLKMLRGWRFARGALDNNQVRYLTSQNAVMFVVDEDHALIHFKPGFQAQLKLVVL